MPEESLRRLIDRLNDDDFRQRLEADPEEALSEFDLSPTEMMALVANDEDALRRLAGSEASRYAIAADITTNVSCDLLRRRTSVSTCGKTDNPTICELYSTQFSCPK